MKLAHGSNPRVIGHWGMAVVASLTCLFIGTGGAQAAGNPDYQNDPQSQGDRGDPPARVGRLADLTGQVWLFSPDSGDWVAATRNRPLTSGDRLSTDAGARAEVRIGSTTLRLDAEIGRAHV